MPIIAVPSEKNGGLNDFLNLRFGKCNSITTISIEDGNIESVKVVPIYRTETIGNLGIHIAEIIGQNKASNVIIGYIGKKAFQSLNSQNISIFQASSERITVKQCFDLFIQGNLKEVKEPNAHLIKE